MYKLSFFIVYNACFVIKILSLFVQSHENSLILLKTNYCLFFVADLVRLVCYTQINK